MDRACQPAPADPAGGDRERFGLHSDLLVANTAYGSAPMLGWLVDEQGIDPCIPVIDKSERKDGTFSRGDFDERRIGRCMLGVADA